MIFYVDWDSQYHHYFILTWTHIIDYYIFWRYILCWLGLTTSSLLYVQWDSHPWSWYSLKIQSMLTGTHNSSSLHVDLDSHLWSWYFKKKHILCWLGLTTSSLLNVDSDSQHWLKYHVIYFMLTETHTLSQLHVDFDLQPLTWYHIIYSMLTWINNTISISFSLGLTTLIMISCNLSYADWD